MSFPLSCGALALRRDLVACGCQVGLQVFNALPLFKVGVRSFDWQNHLPQECYSKLGDLKMKLIATLFLVCSAMVSHTSFARCETERASLARCEASTLECTVDSDCRSGQECLAGSCVAEAPRQQQVICVCSQYSSDVYIVRKVYIGATLVSTDRIERVHSMNGNPASHLLEVCYSRISHHSLCQ